MTEGTFTVTKAEEITRKDIADILTTCFEGGSNYWIDEVPDIPKSRRKVEMDGAARYDLKSDEVGMWYSHFGAAGGIVTLDVDHGGGEFTLTVEKIVEGIRRASEFRGMTIKAWLESCPDASEADLALQFALFGEVVFG